MARHAAAGASARLRNWINAYRRYSEVMFAAPELIAVAVTTETTGFVHRLVQAGLMDVAVHHVAFRMWI